MPCYESRDRYTEVSDTGEYKLLEKKYNDLLNNSNELDKRLHMALGELMCIKNQWCTCNGFEMKECLDLIEEKQKIALGENECLKTENKRLMGLYQDCEENILDLKNSLNTLLKHHRNCNIK
jgi:hypothetical protein